MVAIAGGAHLRTDRRALCWWNPRPVKQPYQYRCLHPRPTRRTDLPGAGTVQHAAEPLTGEATRRSTLRAGRRTADNVLVWTFRLVQRSTLRTFLATLDLLVSAIQVQQHRLPIRWDRKAGNNVGFSSTAYIVHRSYIPRHLYGLGSVQDIHPWL